MSGHRSHFYGFGAPDEMPALVKTTPSGDVIWSTPFPCPGCAQSAFAHGPDDSMVVLDIDGAQTESFVKVDTKGRCSAFVEGLDLADGRVVWSGIGCSPLRRRQDTTYVSARRRRARLSGEEK